MHFLPAKELDQGGRLWELYRQACADSLYFFAKAVFTLIPAERNLISPKCHMPICKALEDDSIRRLLIEWPRRHLKTTIVTVTYPVWKLVRMVVNGEDPYLRFALYSTTTTNSRRFLREITANFKGNEFFQFLFPELIPDFGSRDSRWTEDEATVPRIYNPKEPTFDCLGGGKATSRHYDEIIADDMVDEENYDSATAMEKVITYHKHEENLLEDASGRIITTGNRWAMNDLNHHIHTNELNTAVLSASVYGPRLKERGYDKYYCRNLPESVMELLRQMPDGEPIWPERFTKEDLGRILQKQGPRIFSAQYLNNPSDPEATDFRPDWIKYCRVIKSAKGRYYIEPEDSDPVPFDACNFYITMDPALEGKHSSSRTAILVAAVDSKERIFFLEDYASRQDWSVAVDALLKYAVRYRPWLTAIGIEKVVFSSVIGDIVEQRARKYGLSIPIQKLTVPTNKRKDQRIRAWLGPVFKDGRGYIRQGCNLFVEEYINFGIAGAFNDLMDCAAHLSNFCTPPPDEQTIQHYKEQEERLRRRLGITGYGSALAIPASVR